jgi:VIT1/CCC1 family predicted Fe2+/Mn2+ transporter
MARAAVLGANDSIVSTAGLIVGVLRRLRRETMP